MDRVNPRAVLRKAMSMLEDARCPECGRNYDPVQDAETYLPRRQPLGCSWCSQRLILRYEFQAWQQQESIPRRAALKARAENRRRYRPDE